jgi:hypothetical protein
MFNVPQHLRNFDKTWYARCALRIEGKIYFGPHRSPTLHEAHTEVHIISRKKLPDCTQYGHTKQNADLKLIQICNFTETFSDMAFN